MDITASRPLAVATGASSGIGRELAARFAEGGFDLVVAAEDKRRGSVAGSATRVLPEMIAAGRGGGAVYLVDGGGRAGPYHATYAASKVFLLSFAEALRYELRESGVTVTALMPGAADTEVAGLVKNKVQAACAGHAGYREGGGAGSADRAG